MSARDHHALLMAADGGSLAALIASLSPITWLRLNDNAASGVVTDSAASPANGTLYAITGNVAPTGKNTSVVSTAGLIAGDADKAFDFALTTMLESPNRALSNATGWTVFFIAKPTGPPAAGASNIGAIFQLSAAGFSCPEAEIAHVSTGIFRLRYMISGTSEITMSATPNWGYGTKLSVAVKKEAGGNLKAYVNGSLVATSTSAPSFSYSSGAFRWGAARFGSGTPATYYPFPGILDELTVFGAPLSDAICADLTARAGP